MAKLIPVRIELQVVKTVNVTKSDYIKNYVTETRLWRGCTMDIYHECHVNSGFMARGASISLTRDECMTLNLAPLADVKAFLLKNLRRIDIK